MSRELPCVAECPFNLRCGDGYIRGFSPCSKNVDDYLKSHEEKGVVVGVIMQSSMIPLLIAYRKAGEYMRHINFGEIKKGQVIELNYKPEPNSQS